LRRYVDILDVGTMMLHTHQMVMWPKLWKQLRLSVALEWSHYPFSAASAQSIPDQPGVYAFLIKPSEAGSLGAAYLMYIGETERGLRTRFKEYLLESASERIRPKLLRILPLYTGYLEFACAPVPSLVTPRDVETTLIGAFLPPGNDKIESSIGRTRKAF